MYHCPPQIHNKKAAIVCNGPSLRGFDFACKLKGYVSFGMNLAYRYWNVVGWYPDYYSCLDRVVGMAHLKDIKRLVRNASDYGIKGFLLRHNVVAALGLQDNDKVQNFDALVADDASFFRGYWANTGSLSAAWAAMKGYRRLVLLGADASYVKYVEGAVHMSELVLKVQIQPTSNPNYFFDDYQRKGDIYHVPMRQHPDFPHEDQLLGWHMIRPQLQRTGTLVVNASPNSQVSAFPRCRFEDAEHALQLARRRELYASRYRALSAVYERVDGAVLDTAALIAEVCGDSRRGAGVVVDIGAYHGAMALPFLQQGWQVHAIEADPSHLQTLTGLQATYPKLHVEHAVMSCVAGRKYPWFHHVDHEALHAMKGFSDEYVPAGEVETKTVRKWCEQRGIVHINVLLCDVVGFELMVLRGVDFENNPPDCIVCAWNDLKSLHLGTDTHDLGSFLLACGYDVYMSEWYPQLGASLSQQWKRLCAYPADPEHQMSWGHFFAFRGQRRTGRLRERLRRALKQHIAVGAALPPSPLPPLHNQERIPYVIHY